MKGLTAKEEEIMGFFWKEGSLFVRQLLAYYEDPKPHFNTLSTIVRGLEEKGFLGHEAFGNTYQYHAVISEEEFQQLVPQCRFFTGTRRRYLTGRTETTYSRSRKSTPKRITYGNFFRLHTESIRLPGSILSVLQVAAE